MSEAWQIIHGKSCSHCNTYCDMDNFYTTGNKADGTKKYQSWCKKCISSKMKSYHKKTYGEDKLTYVNHKRTKNKRSYLCYLRSKAINRKGDCISLDDLEDLYINQDGRCALTGIKMSMILGDGVVNTNVSIDRIDSNLGYIKGNVQLVCRMVNIAKHNLSNDEFLNMCKLITNKHGL